MTKKRTKEPWMSGAEYGRRMPAFTVNLIVADVAQSLRFYTEVLGAQVEYQDPDFAALRLAGLDFMLHADHTYEGHGLYSTLAPSGKRGSGAELRLMGVDPDGVQQRAELFGAEVLQAVADRGQWRRDVTVSDSDGYVWAVGVLLPVS
jgi:catechol 2,3-dioxygenase-like lactoylglutathione lyase family enzyme